jgi:hypothetical protein
MTSSKDFMQPLDGREIVLLIEALDHFIGRPEGVGPWDDVSEEELVRLGPYRMLRSRLKRVVRMSFYDTARTWLDDELRQERIAITDRLLSILAGLLKDPAMNRRTIREAFVATSRELREKRQSRQRPGVW